MTISSIERQMKILAAQLKKLKEVALHQVSPASISETHAAELAYIHDEKARIHERLPELAKEMGQRSKKKNIMLDSFIISATLKEKGVTG